MQHVREGYFPVRGGQLYFREIGSGPPIVLVHGGPDFNHNYLLPELDALSSAFRLIYYDQRGRGQSWSGFAAEDVDIVSEVDDLARLRQCFGLGTIAVLGHSWGSLLAMEYAARHPEHVSHLILLNTAPASHADLLLFQRQRQAAETHALEEMRTIAGTPDYAAGDIDTDAQYYRAHFRKTLRRPDQLEQLVRRRRLHFTPESIVQARAIENRLYAQTWSSEGYDLPARLRSLKVPTLVVHGDLDFIPLECADHVARAISGSRLVVLDGCGHFAHVERPAEVHGAITKFLAGGEPPPRSAAAAR